MPLELLPATDLLRGKQSCVCDVQWNAAGLSIYLEIYTHDSEECANYEVRFEHDRGFFVLDDADLPSWLRFPALASGHLLYEVAAGGWLRLQPDQSLAVASAQCREWLVATGNECVSVFSASMPSIRRLEHGAT